MFWSDNDKGEVYGDVNGTEVRQYHIENKNGLKASIITYGAVITNLWTPDKNGTLGDILLGYENLDGYLQPTNPYMNCIVGRVANRINNAKYLSGGNTIEVSKNHGNHQLHGGFAGFDKKIWSVIDVEKNNIRLQCVSEDGEEGFPGEVTCNVKYELDNDDQLHLVYKATSSKATPIILTNHAYFNLSCGSESDVLHHHLQVTADQILETNGDYIPTGNMIDVKNTAFDVNKPTLLATAFEQIKGYDHFWVFDGKQYKPRLVSRLSHEKSGRYTDTYTTEPGMQVYTSNGWNGQLKNTKSGQRYDSYAGVCLETQMFLDSMNHPIFPSPFIEKGQEYRQHTIYKFGVL